MGDDPVTGRLAPSPTGALHLGHAFSFLAASWSARSRGGRLLLRLEDVDTDRAADEHIRSCIEDLCWLGIAWDGEPILQSARTEHHTRAIDLLLARGLAYPCVCTRRELLLAGSREESPGAPHDAGARYPGTCRGKYASVEEAQVTAQREAGLRFRVGSEPVSFHDRVFGDFSEVLTQSVGDFLILRRNKVPAYQLAVVADDHRDAVTEVVRGSDLLSSTARQIALSRALGIPPPSYGHLPLVCDATGRRLAKRDQARSLQQMRAEGIAPSRIVRWAWRALGQSPTIPHPDPLAFRWEAVPRANIVLPERFGEVL